MLHHYNILGPTPESVPMKTSDHLADGLRLFKSSSGGIFNGFFAAGKNRTYRKDSLVDGRARRVFDLMAAACEAGVYPYQMALQTRSGPFIKAENREMLMLSSYDYLGLIGDPRVDEAAIEAIRKYGTGTGGVRMLTGTIDLHHQMEEELAEFKGMPESITFSSGYLANLAVVAALLTAQDRVILDALSHRSLVDACRLSGVQIQRFAHNDPASLRKELETQDRCAPDADHLRRRFLDGWRYLPPAGTDRVEEGIRLLPDDRRVACDGRARAVRARYG